MTVAASREVLALSEVEPIAFRARTAGAGRSASGTGYGDAPAAVGETRGHGGAFVPSVTVFTRQELSEIFNLYGRMVAAGEWRDYALDMLAEKAVFSVFRRSSECPLYRIEKVPRLARKQGAFSVVAASGMILKRGHELGRVLAVLERKPRLVE